MQTIEKFAETNRVHIRLDECGDKIIPGRRGMLYFDAGKLCLMVTDGQPANVGRWKSLGGKLWMGDISKNAKGVKVQDVKVEGITDERGAIRMADVKRIRLMSEAQKESLRKARELSPLMRKGDL